MQVLAGLTLHIPIQVLAHLTLQSLTQVEDTDTLILIMSVHILRYQFPLGQYIMVIVVIIHEPARGMRARIHA